MTGWYRQDRRGGRAAMTVTALAASVSVVAAGCSTSRQPRAGAAPAGGSVTAQLRPGRQVVLRLPGGFALTVPAGAVSAPGTVSARTTIPPAAAPAGLAFAGPVYTVTVSGTSLIGPAQLTVPVPGPATASGQPTTPNAALLGFYDQTDSQWHVAPAGYDPAAHTLTSGQATLTDAASPGPASGYRLVLLGLSTSTWTSFTVDTGKIADAAGRAVTRFFTSDAYVTQPSCPGGNNLAATGIKVASDTGDLIKWCAGPDTAGGADLVEANNRTYTVEIDYPASWSVQRLGDSDPIFDQAVTGLAHLVTVPDPGTKAILVRGGGSVRFRDPSGVGETHARPSAPAYLTDAIVYGAETLASTFDDIPGVKSDPSKSAKAVSLAFTSSDCLRSMDEMGHENVHDAASAWSLFYSAVGLATGCLADQWKVAYGLSGFVASFAVSVLTWLVDGIHLVLQGVRGTVDSVIYFNAYKVAVNAGTLPDTPSMNLQEVAAGNYASLIGTWTEEAYAVNRHDGKGEQWTPGGTDTLTITDSAIDNATQSMEISGGTLSYGSTSTALSFDIKENHAEASLADQSVGINWQLGFYPKATVNLDSQLKTNNGVQLDNARDTIYIWSSNNGYAQVFSRTTAAPA